MNIKLLVIVLFMSAPLLCFAQGKSKEHGHKDKGHGHETVVVKKYKSYKIKGGPPPWAPAHGYRAQKHVYFPDYYTFYDPYRGGYVYWDNSAWVFSPAMPYFLTNVNLGTARVQLLSNVPLTTPPETYYPRYVRSYPARVVNINIQIPHP